VTRALPVLLTVSLLGAFVYASAPPAGGATGVRGVHLTAINSRVHSKGASLVIEASEPVPYVATRPDPLTVLVDFRNVDAEGVANRVAASAKSPIAGVAVEPAESMGGGASRVRVTLLQPVAHRVRSERNTVVIDFDKPGTAAPYVLPPASRSSAPDAMKALERVEETAVDPLAAFRQAGSPASNSQPPPQAPASPPPAQQPAPPPDQQLGLTRGERRFTGHSVSLDFQDADLRAVLRTFAEISGLNLVIDPAIKGTVDLALRDVPWDQAFDIILRANKLGYVADGTIVRIAPLNALADEEAQRRKLSDQQALAGDLGVLTKALSYAKAGELAPLLTRSALSVRGTVQVDPRTNTLIITDLPAGLATATDLIGVLDRAQPQVEIEARIVQTSKDYARALGIRWGFNGSVDPALGNTTNLAFPNSGSLTGKASGTTTPPPLGTAVNLGVEGAPNAIALKLGAINGAFNLDVALSALERTGNVRLLSTPRVTTQNNVPAEVAQGVQIPYQTTSNNTVTTAFKDAALTLKVTPQITEAGTVIMKIEVDNGSVGEIFNGVPSIATQRANTTVLVNDGQTTVIGGIYQSSTTTNNDHTPGLGRLPIFKWLFNRDSQTDTNKELLIFITPRIIKG
jgi:type IV pilus assembly protein PilQ